MTKAEKKQAKAISETKTWLTNREAADKAICHFFGVKYPTQYDWAEPRQESAEQFALNAKLSSKNNGVRAVVSWPKGQEGHGSVTIMVPAIQEGGTLIGGNEQKYACWKNDKGEVEVTGWSEPPKMYQYWHAHGVEWPRNKRMILPAMFLCIFITWVLISIMSGMTIALATLGGIEMLSIYDIEPGTQPLYVFLTSGVVIGAALGGYITRCLYRINQRIYAYQRWENDSKKIQNAAKEKYARATLADAPHHLEQK